jgi:hypothetical protein
VARLNPLFQTCKTGLLLEYSQIEETTSPAALNLALEWILQHTRQVMSLTVWELENPGPGQSVQQWQR